jgi:hypothetical protein
MWERSSCTRAKHKAAAAAQNESLKQHKQHRTASSNLIDGERPYMGDAAEMDVHVSKHLLRYIAWPSIASAVVKMVV